MLVEVFGKQEGTFLRAGRTEAVQLPALGVEALTGKRTKILEAAIRAPAAHARLPPKGLQHWIRAIPCL